MIVWKLAMFFMKVYFSPRTKSRGLYFLETGLILNKWWKGLRSINLEGLVDHLLSLPQLAHDGVLLSEFVKVPVFLSFVKGRLRLQHGVRRVFVVLLWLQNKARGRHLLFRPVLVELHLKHFEQLFVHFFLVLAIVKSFFWGRSPSAAESLSRCFLPLRKILLAVSSWVCHEYGNLLPRLVSAGLVFLCFTGLQICFMDDAFQFLQKLLFRLFSAGHETCAKIVWSSGAANSVSGMVTFGLIFL